MRVGCGYPKILVLLKRKGWKIGKKLVYRLYCEEGLDGSQRQDGDADGRELSGADAGNYVLDSVGTTTANITTRTLTVGATGVSKVHDGTTNATVTLSDNRVLGDGFTDSYTAATFANKSVGTAKTVRLE